MFGAGTEVSVHVLLTALYLSYKVFSPQQRYLMLLWKVPVLQSLKLMSLSLIFKRIEIRS